MRSVQVKCVIARLLFYIFLLICFLLGYAPAAESAPAKEVVLSTVQLRVLLNEFVFQFTGRTEKAADEILALESSLEIRKNALLWKINAIPECFRAASIYDPMGAIIDSWVFSKQLVYFFETGAGKGIFGAHQAIALKAVRDIEEKVSEIAITVGARDEMVKKVDVWADILARETPLDNLYFTRGSILQSYYEFVEKEKVGMFKSIVQATESLDVLKDLLIMYAENMPNQARWQVELLLMDMLLNTPSTGLPVFLEETKAALLSDLHQEWEKVLVDVDAMRIDTLQHITGERSAVMTELDQKLDLVLRQITAERSAVMEELDRNLNLVLKRITAEREAAIGEVEAATLRVSEELINRGNDKADRLLMKAFRLAIALAVIVIVLVMVGAFVLRKRPEYKTNA